MIERAKRAAGLRGDAPRNCRMCVRLATSRCCAGEHAQRQGWTVAQIYTDEAVSGASVHGREALLRMVEDAEHGCFEIILAEHIDRIARNAAVLSAPGADGIYRRGDLQHALRVS